MFQVQETSPAKTMLYGRTVVGQSPIQLTIVTGPTVRGILIRAPGIGESNVNTDMVYVGDYQVTVATGFPLTPGAAIELPIDDPSQIYVVSSSANQTVAWMAV